MRFKTRTSECYDIAFVFLWHEVLTGSFLKSVLFRPNVKLSLFRYNDASLHVNAAKYYRKKMTTYWVFCDWLPYSLKNSHSYPVMFIRCQHILLRGNQFYLMGLSLLLSLKNWPDKSCFRKLRKIIKLHDGLLQHYLYLSFLKGFRKSGNIGTTWNIGLTRTMLKVMER